MLMTEEEARQKVCPIMRHCINEAGVIDGSEPAIYGPSLCTASACMAWRWHDDKHDENGYVHLGFCGLAGKPS